MVAKYTYKTNSYDIPAKDAQALAEILPANDSLYAVLEARYGGGFAQWVVDRLGEEAEEA
jgi:hypothetical protein